MVITRCRHCLWQWIALAQTVKRRQSCALCLAWITPQTFVKSAQLTVSPRARVRTKATLILLTASKILSTQHLEQSIIFLHTCIFCKCHFWRIFGRKTCMMCRRGLRKRSILVRAYRKYRIVESPERLKWWDFKSNPLFISKLPNVHCIIALVLYCIYSNELSATSYVIYNF